MCGIAGIVRTPERPVAESEVRGMLDLIAHRGPDGSGVHLEAGVGLGHVRLAILDLSEAAAQPMVSHDGRFVLTFNGEIYNFRELRERLTERGIEVRSTGDTEVLLELIAAFGLREILPDLEGFFAIGLWDRREGSLALARDRHGIKPLYYRRSHDGGLHFASEIKPLIGPETPPNRLLVCAAMLGWGCVDGKETLFEDIQHVEPGHYLRFAVGKDLQDEAFFVPTDFIDPALYAELARASDEEVSRRIEAAFDQSIDYRLLSDAPVACMVSGGIDSSLITAAAARRSKETLTLFHAAVQHDSERPWAERIAKELDLEMLVAEVSDEDYLDNLPTTTWHAEIPLLYHPNSVPFFLVCRLAASQGIKVVLTGEGSDEYYLGYPMIIIERYLRSLRRMTGFTRTLFHRVFPRGGPLLWPGPDRVGGGALVRLLHRFSLENVTEEVTPRLAHVPEGRDRDLSLESIWLVRNHLLTVLHRNDRLGMASGIESRFPFLGHALSRLAMNLPARHKIRMVPRLYNIRHPFHVDKWAVRQLAGKFLPRDFVERPKKGFPITIERRLSIAPGLFQDSAVQEWFELDRRSIQRLPERCDQKFMLSLLLVEVWASLLWRDRSIDDVREDLKRHVRVQPV